MKVEQIASLCNTISGEVLGKTEVVQNDLAQTHTGYPVTAD